MSRVDASEYKQRLHATDSETIGMQELSSEGRKIVDDLARRHGVGSDAVAALLCALELGSITDFEVVLGGLSVPA